jgi:hypothetical protein
MRMSNVTEVPPITKDDGVELKGGLFHFIFQI